MRLKKMKENLDISIFLDDDTLEVFEGLAEEVGVGVEEFISDMLAGYFEIASLLPHPPKDFKCRKN
mgnify:CR=1 FL=1